MYNQVKPVTERCKIQKLNEDAYYMIIEFENHRVDEGYADLLEEGWFRFVVNSNANVVFHFINYRITSIWEYFNDEIPVSYSEVGGAISPQNTKSTQALTTAFKGPHETVMFLELTPTKYTSEVDDLKYKGYRLNLKDVELGDTANK